MEEENKKSAASYNTISNNFNPWWWGTSNNHNIIPTTPGHHSHQWLQATLSDLDEKAKAMLSLIIQEDGDSFVHRAEMYYKNKPVLVKMVKELHTSYCSLAERYEQLRSESVGSIQQAAGSSSSSSSGDSKLETPYESNPESTVEDPPDDLQCEISKSDFIFLRLTEFICSICRRTFGFFDLTREA